MIRASLIGIAVMFTVFWVAAPAVLQAPQGAGAPFVKSVSFYKDWQLTQPLNTRVEPGTTLYTKIVFSEPMQLRVADDSSARPVLYYHIAGERIRYRIARHGAGGADFVSGDAKPLHSGTDDYICKYTIPEGATGEFRTLVGKLSADTSGNTMETFYTHPARLTIGNMDVTPLIGTVSRDLNFRQLAIVGGGKAPSLPQPIATPVDTETIIDMLDTTDIVNIVDTAPDQEPRGEAFIFRKFLEQMLSDLKSTFPAFDYDLETIFQTPGKGFHDPLRGKFGGFYFLRPQNFHMLGIFVPDALRTASLQQVSTFASKYKLTMEEIRALLRNLRRARILVFSVRVVYMPDRNLREAVVAKINEQAAKSPSEREVPEEFFIQIGGPKKTSDPIYAGEMLLIGSLKAEAAGIEDLTGLEYATNLRGLHLGNKYGSDWDVLRIGGTGKYRVTKPETPNRISDLGPLENLTNLTVLDLECNAVANLYPLSYLKNLQWLALTENKITDISPLKNLTNLTFLALGNHYYSPEWAGNNKVRGISPLGNLNKLETLYVHHNPIEGRIDIVRSLPKLYNLGVGCCGVSNLRPFLEHPRLGQKGGIVYLVYSPLTEEDLPDLAELIARGVDVENGLLWDFLQWDGSMFPGGFPGNLEDLKDLKRTPAALLSTPFNRNQVEKCSESYRESIRSAPTLQLSTNPNVLSSLWQDLSQVPEETALLPNYPNPFNPETWIPYQLTTAAEVRVVIHAADGQLVRTLALGYQDAGVYQSKGRAAYWDGRNAQREPVASGVYFYTLSTGDFTATRKMLIRK